MLFLLPGPVIAVTVRAPAPPRPEDFEVEIDRWHGRGVSVEKSPHLDDSEPVDVFLRTSEPRGAAFQALGRVVGVASEFRIWTLRCDERAPDESWNPNRVVYLVAADCDGRITGSLLPDDDDDIARSISGLYEIHVPLPYLPADDRWHAIIARGPGIREGEKMFFPALHGCFGHPERPSPEVPCAILSIGSILFGLGARLRRARRS